MTISLCVICKNEEHNITRCLEGVREAVDEMIVVDTGSTDNTVAMARELGAKVYYYEWDNNFANARNYALKQAKNDWIIFLDADEYFLPEHAKLIAEMIGRLRAQRNLTDAIMMRHISIDEGRGGVVVETNRLVRAFRKSTLEYERPIHESLTKKTGKIHLLDATDSKAVVYHTGYTLEWMKHKAQRNLELLLKDEQDGTGDELTQLYLSDSYMGLGQLEKALDYGIRYIDKGRVVYGFNAKPYSNVIRCLISLGKKHELIIDWIERAIERFPGHPDFVWLKGLQFLREQRYSTALGYLLEADQLKDNYDGSESVRITFSLAEIYNNIAAIYVLMHDHLTALEYYVKSLKIKKYEVNAFDGLFTITKPYPREELIALLNSIYGHADEDLTFLINRFCELREGQLLLYYAKRSEWIQRHKSEGQIPYYILYLNGKYEEAYHMLDKSTMDTAPDDVVQVYMVVNAMLSLSEDIIAMALRRVAPSFQRILGVYAGVSKQLFTEDTHSLIAIFSEIARVCSDEQLQAVFMIEQMIEVDLSQQMAAILVQRRRYKLALHYFNSVQQPLDGEAWFQRGICYYNEGLYTHALQAFDQAKLKGIDDNRVEEYITWTEGHIKTKRV
ncbi:glycosyltransferase [Paenibacillus sp. FSL R7-0331]|uniref:glycosyltransferase n=1 Tax=Paenibacillus sp. FSL R7-0331 TaxID=1536773 RepID=UPI0004F7DCB7|nr:glycosyltransferase [Paenibacillus sp. FSL R7-0331]AIQ55152.1 hypothetical protein R70331_29140 [Paenibacillus sp. FSL R7-0331]